jgi:RNA polymerase primary sigma factor
VPGLTECRPGLRLWASMRSGNGGSTTERDRALVAAVLAGKPDAITRFIQEISTTVWASCRALSGYEGEARDNFLEVMGELRDSGFAAFREYDGRSSLKTFASLAIRDLYCRKLLQLFDFDPAKAWRIFGQLFEADIRRLIHRRLPAMSSEDIHQDLYQSVCVALVDQDYRRIRAYSGKGSFSGFVLRCADNIVGDEIRIAIAPRRRLPAAISRLAELDREVFRLVFWDRVPNTGQLAHRLRSRFSRDFPTTEVESALARVRTAAEKLRATPPPQETEDSAEPTPEDIFVQAEDDEQLSAALGALTQAIQILPDDERLYLMLILRDDPPPPRDVARIMRRPVDEVYAMKQRVLKKLRELVCEDSAVKSWLTSV